jgi:hypothetical protein
MIEGLAFGKSGYDYGDKGCNQKDAYTLKANLVAASPDGTGNALEKLGDSELADPDEKSIGDARCEDQFGAYLTEVDLVRSEICSLDIVGAV